uniref:Ig-like domain-containing protein n=1 Tax=Trichobilharzia regenti TaxID=157069 RepID=A0AA85JTJ5_TRIRE|nr:unnamed protein product [Trichobilharzia regenti]
MPTLLYIFLRLSHILLFICLTDIICLDILKKGENNSVILPTNHTVNSLLNKNGSTKVKSLRKIRTQNNAKSKFLYRRSDLIDSDKNDIIKMKAVLNHTALLPCRPDKKLLSENGIDENTKGTLLWKRTKTNDYLIHNNRRLHPDTRYILDMSSFDQTILDLRIDRVQRTDEGEYVCLYSNGQTVYKQRVYLNILVPPVISENSSSSTRVIAHEGEAVVLQCKAWGVPEPIITWYLTPKEGRQYRIYEATDKRFTIKPNQLIISNITRDLHGTYKCLAQNGLEQNAWRVIDIDVRYPPTIEMANLKLGQLLRGTTMVRAVIAGNPINLFYWEFEGRPIHGPNSNCLIPLPNEKYCILIGTYSSPSTTWDNPFGGSYEHHTPSLLTNYQGSYEKMSEKLNKRATYLTQDRLQPSSFSSMPSSSLGQSDYSSISATSGINHQKPPVCSSCSKYKSTKDSTTNSPNTRMMHPFNDYAYFRNFSHTTIKFSLSTFHLFVLNIFTLIICKYLL